MPQHFPEALWVSSNTSCNGFRRPFSRRLRDSTAGTGFGTQGAITNTLFEGNTYAIYSVDANISNCIFNNNHKGLMEFWVKPTTAASVEMVWQRSSHRQPPHEFSFLNDTVAVAYAAALTTNVPGPWYCKNRICGSVNYYFENKVT
ncbi:MAG: hypothetical protein IPN95_26300 [Bacteroidetes bacterium]|nr:hypothetical protein [Bacteroidota bacterium]